MNIHAQPRSAPRQAGISRHVESPKPLHYAAADGDVESVRKLLHEGADPNATAYFGATPLHLVVRVYAWRRRNYRAADSWAECARLLLEAGADPMLRCFPDCTPAGVGEGDVPPALRDVMVVLAARGVWRDDDRNHRERGEQSRQMKRTYSRTNVRHPTDMPHEETRPGERSIDPLQRISDATLDALTAKALLTEEREETDRTAVSPEHVFKDRRNGRKSCRKAHSPARVAVDAAVAMV